MDAAPDRPGNIYAPCRRQLAIAVPAWYHKRCCEAAPRTTLCLRNAQYRQEEDIMLRVFNGWSWSGADRWLDRSANLGVLVVALLIGVSVFGASSQRRPPDRPPDYQPGDRLDLSRVNLTGPGLILVTRSTCPACSASAPFYRTLRNVRLAAVAAGEQLETNRKYLTANGISTLSLTSMADSGLTVSGLPTLIAVAGDGRVIKTWRGQLTASEQRDVMKTVQGVQP